MNEVLLPQLARAAYAIFVASRSVGNLWGRPINDFDLERAVYGYVAKGTAEFEQRKKEPFSNLSITVSAFVISGLTKIFNTREELIISAVSDLTNYCTDKGAYWSSYKPSSPFRGAADPDVSPRHTASALQIYHQIGDDPPNLIKSIRWLVKCKRGFDPTLPWVLACG